MAGRGDVHDAVLDPPAAKTLAVTFDDGFASVLERAEPILSSLGLVATVFAPTSFMSEPQHLRGGHRGLAREPGGA